MFMAALFTIAKLQKQSKCLSIDEWMKMLYITIYNIYTIEYYSDIKNETLPFGTTWIDLESVK